GGPDRLRPDNDRQQGWPDANTPGPKPASGLAGDTNTDARGSNRLAKETKWDGTGGRESEHSIVPGKRGNAASGPRGGKGVPNHGTVGGKHGGGLGTRAPGNEKTTENKTGEARPPTGALHAGATPR